MKLFVVLAVVAHVAIGGKISGGMPVFSVVSSRSGEASPQITVTFANGVTDSLALSSYQPIQSAGSCAYIGKLAHDADSSVAVTGCLDIDEALQVTLLSSASSGSLFSIGRDGVTSALADPLAAKGAVSRAVPIPGRKRSKSKSAAACATPGCNLPAALKGTVKLGYDRSLRDHLGEANVASKMVELMVHVQAHFLHSSLVTQMQLEVQSGLLFSDTVWTAENNLDDARLLNSDASVDFNAWMCKDPVETGTIGIAFMASACSAEYKTSVNEWDNAGAAPTAKTVAHEIGHNLGMDHDFEAKNSGKGCTGIMNYGDTPDTWSTCAVNDFDAAYVAEGWAGGCLDSVPTVSTTSTTTTTTTASVCVTSWNGDAQCDDDQNVAACQWDGGDCCNNSADGWDDYCSVCACLDPGRK